MVLIKNDMLIKVSFYNKIIECVLQNTNHIAQCLIKATIIIFVLTYNYTKSSVPKV